MRTVKSAISGREISYDETKYRDLKGNVVEKNPIEYPYSYNPYVIYKASNFKTTDIPYYSNRVEHCYFPSDKIKDALSKIGLKHNGPACKRMSWKNQHHVENLMSILLEKDVKCTAILEGCNCANGYLYWIVYIQG